MRYQTRPSVSAVAVERPFDHALWEDVAQRRFPVSYLTFSVVLPRPRQERPFLSQKDRTFLQKGGVKRNKLRQ